MRLLRAQTKRKFFDMNASLCLESYFRFRLRNYKFIWPLPALDFHETKAGRIIQRCLFRMSQMAFRLEVLSLHTSYSYVFEISNIFSPVPSPYLIKFYIYLWLWHWLLGAAFAFFFFICIWKIPYYLDSRTRTWGLLIFGYTKTKPT